MSTIVAVAASGRFLGTVPCPPSTTCGGSTVAAPPPVGMVGMAFVLVDLVGASTAFVAAAAEDGPEAAETAVEDEEAEEEETGEDTDDDAGDFAAGEAAAATGLVLCEGDVGAGGDGGDEGDGGGGGGGFGYLDERGGCASDRGAGGGTGGSDAAGCGFACAGNIAVLVATTADVAAGGFVVVVIARVRRRGGAGGRPGGRCTGLAGDPGTVDGRLGHEIRLDVGGGVVGPGTTGGFGGGGGGPSSSALSLGLGIGVAGTSSGATQLTVIPAQFAAAIPSGEELVEAEAGLGGDGWGRVGGGGSGEPNGGDEMK